MASNIVANKISAIMAVINSPEVIFKYDPIYAPTFLTACIIRLNEKIIKYKKVIPRMPPMI
jgi:hypothetical protein